MLSVRQAATPSTQAYGPAWQLPGSADVETNYCRLAKFQPSRYQLSPPSVSPDPTHLFAHVCQGFDYVHVKPQGLGLSADEAAHPQRTVQRLIERLCKERKGVRGSTHRHQKHNVCVDGGLTTGGKLSEQCSA